MPANVRDSAQGSELGVSAPQTRLGRVGCHGGTRVLARCSPSVRPPLRMLEVWPRDAVHVVNTLLGCGAEFFFFQSWLSSRSKAIIPPPACVLWSHLEAQKTRFCGRSAAGHCRERLQAAARSRFGVFLRGGHVYLFRVTSAVTEGLLPATGKDTWGGHWLSRTLGLASNTHSCVHVTPSPDQMPPGAAPCRLQGPHLLRTRRLSVLLGIHGLGGPGRTFLLVGRARQLRRMKKT